MNYCAECGFKIGEGFKFCPNCGAEIKSAELTKEQSIDVQIEVIICKNCGEENSVDNSVCFSCGVPLNGSKSKKQVSQKPTGNSVRKDSNVESKESDEKTLDNKKLLLISSFVIAIFIFALIMSGVFDSGVKKNLTQFSDPPDNSQVNLANLEEINELESKVTENPDDMESTLHLSHLLQDSGLYEKAIINYRKYLTKFPDNADARVDMAICFYNLGDNATAINEMETALKYNPKHQIAHLNLGIVNLASRNISASKDWFQKTVELDPNSEAGKRAQELLKSH